MRRGSGKLNGVIIIMTTNCSYVTLVKVLFFLILKVSIRICCGSRHPFKSNERSKLNKRYLFPIRNMSNNQGSSSLSHNSLATIQ